MSSERRGIPRGGKKGEEESWGERGGTDGEVEASGKEEAGKSVGNEKGNTIEAFIDGEGDERWRWRTAAVKAKGSGEATDGAEDDRRRR